jgi:hypothetical protein
VSAYRDELIKAIRATHGAEATHEHTTPVREVFRGIVAWEGEVESFTLKGHARAKRCYAWGFKLPDRELDITTVLEIPPVVSPETAVRVAIAAIARKG